MRRGLSRCRTNAPRSWAGTSAAWLGVVPAAVLGGLCTLGVVGGWTLGFKQLRTVDRFEEAANAH